MATAGLEKEGGKEWEGGVRREKGEGEEGGRERGRGEQERKEGFRAVCVCVSVRRCGSFGVKTGYSQAMNCDGRETDAHTHRRSTVPTAKRVDLVLFNFLVHFSVMLLAIHTSDISK